MSKDAKHIIHLITEFELREDGTELIRSLSVIAQLLSELANRQTKATYHRKFTLGKLEIDINFYGMK